MPSAQPSPALFISQTLNNHCFANDFLLSSRLTFNFIFLSFLHVLLPRYKLASSGTFNALIKCACKYVGPLLDHHLPVKHAKIGKGTPLPSTSKAWKKFRAPVKVYLESIAQLLSQLKDPDAANFVLHYDKLLCPYYACKLYSIRSLADFFLSFFFFSIFKSVCVCVWMSVLYRSDDKIR